MVIGNVLILLVCVYGCMVVGIAFGLLHPEIEAKGRQAGKTPTRQLQRFRLGHASSFRSRLSFYTGFKYIVQVQLVENLGQGGRWVRISAV